MPPILPVSDASFDTEVVRNPRPTVVLFFATWAGPARDIATLTTKLAADYAPTLQLASINIDQNPQTPASYGITTLPTFLILHNGLVVDRLTGPISRLRLQTFLAHAQNTWA